MLGDHPAAVEAALIAEYHRDPIAEFWRGEISLRKLARLVEHLPPTSALHRVLNGPWQQQHYQLADLYDSLSVLIEDGRAIANSGHAWQRPAPYPRPETVVEPPQVVERVVAPVRPAPGVKSLAEQIAIATGEGV